MKKTFHIALALLLALTATGFSDCGSGGGPRVEAGFTWAANGLDVRFTDQSTGAAFRQWDFGDLSAPSNEQNPIHRYAAPGSYKVTLRACPSSDFESPDCDTASGLIDVDVVAETEGSIFSTGHNASIFDFFKP